MFFIKIKNLVRYRFEIILSPAENMHEASQASHSSTSYQYATMRQFIFTRLILLNRKNNTFSYQLLTIINPIYFVTHHLLF
ncbi:MAG: hypothetical protein JWP81_2296 [Ferruginibacter sp.]|nr:hypothetical protein [Ferruginibacter sp.]